MTGAENQIVVNWLLSASSPGEESIGLEAELPLKGRHRLAFMVAVTGEQGARKQSLKGEDESRRADVAVAIASIPRQRTERRSQKE